MVKSRNFQLNINQILNHIGQIFVKIPVRFWIALLKNLANNILILKVDSMEGIYGNLV